MQPQVLAGEAAARTELSYTFRVYNVRCPVKPRACRLDIYDPDLSIVQTVPIAQTDFKPVVGQSSTFEVNKVIPFQPQKAGDYHFVVEAQQSLDPRELKDAGKWALERNQNAAVPTFATFATKNSALNEAEFPWVFDSTNGAQSAAATLREVGYTDRSPARPAWWVPSTKGVNLNADVTKAVGDETPYITQGSAFRQTAQYNAAWIFVGHGTSNTSPVRGKRLLFYSGMTTRSDEADFSFLVTTNQVRQTNMEKYPATTNVVMQALPKAIAAPSGAANQPRLYNVRLMVFAGCNTIHTLGVPGSIDLYSLPQIAVSNGARSAVGCYGELKDFQLNTFTRVLMQQLRNGVYMEAALQEAKRQAGFNADDDGHGSFQDAKWWGEGDRVLASPTWGHAP